MSPKGLPSIIRGFAAAALLLGIILFFNLASNFTDLADGWLLRNETAGDSFQERTWGQFSEGREALFDGTIWKRVGTEQVGGNYYTDGTVSFTTFETQLPRLVMETGILGVIGFLSICIGAIVALQSAKRFADAGTTSAIIATQVLLIAVFYTNIVFNQTAPAFVWMIFAAVISTTLPPSHLQLIPPDQTDASIDILDKPK